MPSRNPQVRAIEQEASRLAAADGKSSHKERFALRKAMRADAGLGREHKDRGGVAGVWDRNKEYAPALALAALPFALPAIGGMLGIGGGAAGAGAAAAGGAASAIPGAVAGAAGSALPAAIPAAAGAASSGGMLAGLGGILGKVNGAINSPLGQTVTQLGTAAYGIGQQNKANAMTRGAIAADQTRWREGAPLRDAGRAALLNPTVPDTSALRTLGSRGNPFAIPAGGR